MSIVILLLLISLIPVLHNGCSANSSKNNSAKKASNASQPPTPSPMQGQLTMEVNKAAGNSPVLSEVRNSGILRASVECNRPPLCYKDKYGVARGFEVNILQQAASAMGVKLNIVPPETESPISGPSQYSKAKPDNALIPYYYSSKTGWLAFRVNGDAGFIKATRLIIDHLYDTGTYQQLFVNMTKETQNSGTAGK